MVSGSNTAKEILVHITDGVLISDADADAA